MKKKELPKIQSLGGSPAPQTSRKDRTLPSITRTIMNLTFLKPKNKGNLSVKDLTQNYLLKIKTTMQIDLGKTVNKVRDIENQIKEINLPLQKYMDPEAEGLKPLKNITPVLQKEFPLIQCDPSSFRRNRYIAKDFHLIDINTSKSSSKNTINRYERNRSTPRLLLPQTILEGSRTERFKSERMKLLDLEIEKACLEDMERNKNQSVQARGKSVELVKYQGNDIPKQLLQTTVVRKKFLSALKKGPKNLAKVIKQTEEEKSHKKDDRRKTRLSIQTNFYRELRAKSESINTFR